MIFLEFTLLILSSLGLINIILYSPITEWFRDGVVYIFKKLNKEALGRYLVSCPTCTGFWVGIIMTGVYMGGLIWFTIPLMVSFLGLLGQIYWFPNE